MSFKKRLAAGIAAAAASIVIGASAASADMCPTCNGGAVYNMSSSSGPLLISNGSSSIYLYPGYWSDRYTYHNDTDWFKSPRCAAQRWTGSSWSTVYQPGVWYYLPDSASIMVRVAYC